MHPMRVIFFLSFLCCCCPCFWQQSLVEPVNKFCLNVNGVGCPKPMKFKFYWKSTPVLEGRWKIASEGRESKLQLPLFVARGSSTMLVSMCKALNDHCPCFYISIHSKKKTNNRTADRLAHGLTTKKKKNYLFYTNNDYIAICFLWWCLTWLYHFVI